MGACWSNKIKAETPLQTGLKLKSAGEDDLSGSSTSKILSVQTTNRCEADILQSFNLKSFAFNELKAATRNFRPDSVIGGGGFGSVFKGWIDEQTFGPTKPGTGMMVAVKKLNQESMQGHREWLAEINYLGQLCHPNLVRLVGFCLEDEQRLLVYEFMARGSAEHHLFRRGSYFQPLSWSLRVKVALGAARGLAFLHSCKPKVIYRDFKTSNILLDPNYDAKLSDFGLARDGPTGEKSHVSTRIMGTYGYAAPEYLATGRLTAKNDVYSFGVVLLEMLSGRRVIDKSRPPGHQDLVEWAKHYLNNKRKILQVLDTRLQGQFSLSHVLKAATLALHCLAPEAKKRPTMDDVVRELDQLSTRIDNHRRHFPSNDKATSCSRTQRDGRAGSPTCPKPPTSPLFTL